MEELRLDALSVLEREVDLLAAIEELEGCTSVAGEEGWLNVIRSKSVALGVVPSLLATQLLANALQRPTEDESRLSSLINRMHHLQDERLFDSNHFTRLIMKDLQVLPFGALVCLLESNMLPVVSLLTRPTTDLVDYIQPALQTPKRPLINGLTGALVQEGYGRDSLEAKKLLLSLVYECYQSSDGWREYSILDAVKNVPMLPQVAIHDLHHDVLMEILLKPNHISANDVMSCQEDWCSNKTSPNITALHQRLFEAIPFAMISDTLNKVLTTKQLNWPVLLTFVSSYVSSSQEAARSFKGYIAVLVERAIKERDARLFQGSLLLVRQAALNGAHIHPSYPTWFQSVFGSSTTVSGRASQEFVLTCLTELVPYEPAYCLQAHIAQPIMKLAREKSEDYSMLAQTRLHDLLPGGDIGHSSGLQPSQQVIDDVKAMVDEFVEGRRVPERLLIMYTFRRPYFIGEFLPTLLSTSESICQLPGREEFIAELKRRSKIPNKMYTAYEQRKNGESHGATSQDDSIAKETVAITRVAELLRQLLLVKSTNESEAFHKLVSQLSNALDELVPSQVTATCAVLCWKSPGLESLHVKIVDMVLNELCEILSGDGCQDRVQLFLKMFSGHTTLHKPLLARLWELLSPQITHLSDCQLLALARLLCEMWISHCPTCPLTLQDSTQSPVEVKTFGEYSQCLLEELPLCTHAERMATLSVCCYFITHYLICTHKETDSIGNGSLPCILLAKLSYLQARNPDNVESNKVIDMMTDIEYLKLLWDKSQVGFYQWLVWDLSVQEENLLPLEKDSYLKRRLYDHYLPLASHLGGLESSLVSAARQLFTALIQHGEQGAPSYSSVLGLLQTVCMNGTPVGDSGESLLVGAVLHYLCKTEEKKPLQLIVSVLCSVAPWLMFSCGPTVPSGSLSSVAQCLRELMKRSTSCVLPSSLLHHVCKGLNTFCQSQSDDNLFKLFIKSSPLFESSLLVNWPSLSTALPSSISYSSAYAWLQGNVSQTHPRHLRSTVLGVSLYHTLSTKSTSHQNPIWQVIRNISDSSLRKEVLTVIVDCCAREMGEKVLCDSPAEQQPFLSIAKACVRVYPGSLNACYSDLSCCKLHDTLLDHLRSEFPCSVDACLLPPILFRLLVSLSKNDLQKVIDFRPSLLGVCVSAHAHCMEAACGQALEPAFLQQCTRLSEQFIVQMPFCDVQESAQLNYHSTLKPFLERRLRDRHCVS